MSATLSTQLLSSLVSTNPVYTVYGISAWLSPAYQRGMRKSESSSCQAPSPTQHHIIQKRTLDFPTLPRSSTCMTNEGCAGQFLQLSSNMTALPTLFLHWSVNCFWMTVIHNDRLGGLPSIPLPWRVILKDQIEYCHCTLAALEFQILTFILLPHWLDVFSPFSRGNMHRFVECVLNPLTFLYSIKEMVFY